jgi:hypothetical protein
LLDEQAAFIPQVLSTALAAGADRVAIYKMQDTEDDRQANPEPFGLVRANGSRRPAYVTYQVAVQYLSDFITVRRQRWDAVGQIWLSQPGRNTTVLFSRLPSYQLARVEATAEKAVLVTMWGQRQEITARDGFYNINLPPALCTQPIGDYCMIGGSTFYLVQANDGSDPPEAPYRPGDPTPTPDPDRSTDTPTPTKTPLPTATSTPTNTPTPTATASPTSEPSQTPTATITASPTLQPTVTAPPVGSPSPTQTAVVEEGAANPGSLNGWLVTTVVGLLLTAVTVVTLILRQRR